ncbi:TPA: hypothetical protein O7142_000983 [Salmonella enterica]|uniref:Uncharacterized protein n=1 Tax=Salmonella diarizonae TaxID=59204 RepID=A0A6Y1UAW9_SALDZ|nr:hypothetical protein [Salmonella enterica subsp. diarizonae]EHE1281120.1 hypothetical protein [Salmonella enterica]EEE2302095.1 hypothetical protein [Salmonella enterica subsp. diarizonae]EJN8065331.1 hypothetical protein [Salmonella enterica]HAB4048506.1 hypothetical protein [Salmonella enterica subsp. diarizonae]
MTDTLKALEQDRDRKAQRAKELHDQWQAACKEAADARDAFIKARKQNLKEKQQALTTNILVTKPVNQSSTNSPAPSPSMDSIQICAHNEELIRQKANEITKNEMQIALERKRLEQLELSLLECQQGKSPIEIQEELRPYNISTFWIDKLLKTYLNNYGYAGNSGAELYASDLDRLQLCDIAADLVDLIANELKENLKVIDVMKNRDGLLTTPGHIKDSIYHHICKQCGIDLSTKSVKEHPAAIREALSKWDVDNAFQESNCIMRHWAQLEHNQRKEKHKKKQTEELELKIIEEWDANPGKWSTVSSFIRHIETLYWDVTPKDGKVRNTLKKHGKTID